MIFEIIERCAMDTEEIGSVILYIFFTMTLAGLALVILDIDITSGQAVEFIISLFVYHLLIRNMLYKTYFSVKKSNENEHLLQPKDNIFPFILYAITAMTTSAVIMYIFGVHLSNNTQVTLEILSICFYQYLITRAMNKNSCE